MKKILKSIICLALCAVTVFSFMGCSNEKESPEFIGTWTNWSRYPYGTFKTKDIFRYTFTLNEDNSAKLYGELRCYFEGNDLVASPSSVVTYYGTWEQTEDGIIKIYIDNSQKIVTYNFEYKLGTLISKNELDMGEKYEKLSNTK